MQSFACIFAILLLQEGVVKIKYGGIMPKKPPLIFEVVDQVALPCATLLVLGMSECLVKFSLF